MSYLIFCFCLLIFQPVSVEHVAEYIYTLEDHELQLKFLIEKDELMQFGLNKNCDIKKMTAFCTTQYLNKESKIEVSSTTVKSNLSFIEKSF